MGVTGPTGPTGSGGGSAETCLGKEKTMTGVWSASFSVPVGGPQTADLGAIDFRIPICLPEITPPNEILFVWINEKESEEPIKAGEKGCPGTSGEPAAKPGFLCVFTGGGGGFEEKKWKNVKKPPTLAQAAGNEAPTAGQFGNFIVWKTGEYNATTPVTLAAAAQMTAMGPWAVTPP
jgi:hypothetical protein